MFLSSKSLFSNSFSNVSLIQYSKISAPIFNVFAFIVFVVSTIDSGESILIICLNKSLNLLNISSFLFIVSAGGLLMF